MNYNPKYWTKIKFLQLTATYQNVSWHYFQHNNIQSQIVIVIPSYTMHGTWLLTEAVDRKCIMYNFLELERGGYTLFVGWLLMKLCL